LEEAAARSPDFLLATASPLKKSLQAAERKRADVARARRRWIREQGLLDPARLVFIDETAVTTNMVRLNGWKARGERLVGDVPMGNWETLTFIAGLRQTGIIAPMVIKGPMNGEAFLAYIEQCLVPKLKRRDIVVIDNVSFHKVAGVEEAIQAAGGELRYLPQYSPELNPIELVSSPEGILRKAAERTIKGLERCVGSFIRARGPSEFMGYFMHAGYEPR
jgi:DDE superfamily endonuclease